MIEQIKSDVEFNETWWNAVQEGEVICQDEIEIAKEMTVHIRYLLDELEKADKEIAKYHKLHDDGYNEMRLMQQELEKAQEEITRLNGKVDYKSTIVGYSVELIEDLEKENADMKAALKWIEERGSDYHCINKARSTLFYLSKEEPHE